MQGLERDGLFELLDVRLDRFALYDINRDGSMDCPAADRVIVLFVLGGSGMLSCAGDRYELCQNRVILVPPRLALGIEGRGAPLTCSPMDGGWSLADWQARPSAPSASSPLPGLVLGCGWLDVSVGGVPGLLDHLERPLIEDCDDGALALLFETLATELNQAAEGSKAVVETLTKLILIILLRRHLAGLAGPSPLQLKLRCPQLGRAVATIMTAPEKPHSVESLAGIAGMSRSSFNRHFSASYGCTPMGFIQTVRLRAASRMLLGSNLPVKTVAAAVGYASRSHFSHAFSAEFGTDPSTYRNSRARGDGDAGLPTPGLEGPVGPREKRIGAVPVQAASATEHRVVPTPSPL